MLSVCVSYFSYFRVNILIYWNSSYCIFNLFLKLTIFHLVFSSYVNSKYVIFIYRQFLIKHMYWFHFNSFFVILLMLPSYLIELLPLWLATLIAYHVYDLPRLFVLKLLDSETFLTWEFFFSDSFFLFFFFRCWNFFEKIKEFSTNIYNRIKGSRHNKLFTFPLT